MKLKPAVAAAALAPGLLVLPAAMPGAAAAPHHAAAPAKHKPPRCNYPPSHTTLTLSVSKSAVHPGDRVRAFGSLFNKKCSVKGGTVQLYGNGASLGSATTGGHGGYSIFIYPRHTVTLQARFGGNGQASPASSNEVTVTVTPRHRHHHH